MTHGCLVIKDRRGRKIVLHTYHTGMDIPEAVRESVTLLANSQKFLLEILLERHREVDRDEIRDLLRSHFMSSRLKYVPSVAALIISSRPGFLEPFPKSFHKDVPTRSGMDSPFVLTVCDSSEWVLRDEDGSLLFDVYANEWLIEDILDVAKILAKKSR